MVQADRPEPRGELPSASRPGAEALQALPECYEEVVTDDRWVERDGDARTDPIEALSAAMDRLAPAYRRVAEMMRDGRTRGEIAAKFGTSVKTVSRWRGKILALLREALKGTPESLGH